jgi:hypothetical protein
MRPGPTQRVFIDRGLDLLDRWMADQQARVARLLQSSDRRLTRGRLDADGMDRRDINQDTVIARRQ